MVSAVAKHLGKGIYTPSEAAFYAREHTQTVSRWLYGSKGNPPVLTGEFDPAERLVSFLDFVQLLAIAAIRRQYGVPLQTIHKAIEKAKRHGVDYPFARRHKTFLFQRLEPSQQDAAYEADEDGNEVDDRNGREAKQRRFEIFISVENESLVQMTGRYPGNRVMKEVTELYLTDLHFGTLGLAEQYDAFTYGDLKVTMDPKRHFGEPLTPSRYTAEALWEAVLAEGSIDLAAKAYGVDRKEVELACKYFDYLSRPGRG